MDVSESAATTPGSFASQHVYDADEVQRYVASLHQEMAELRAQLDWALQVAEEARASLGTALAVGERTADQTIAAAERTASEIVAASERRAGEIVAASERQAEETLERATSEVQRVIADANATVEAVFAHLSQVPLDAGGQWGAQAVTLDPADAVTRSGGS